jgi:hypothetical protein
MIEPGWSVIKASMVGDKTWMTGDQGFDGG